MNKNKVSVCVPVYGVEKYIERCARSLFEQTYDNIEFIFVNDCTEDKSISILKSIIKMYPDRSENVKILNHTINKGLAGARNTAIENVTGVYIMWVDSDDYIEKDTVSLAVWEIENNNSDICTFNGIEHHKGYDKIVYSYSFNTVREQINALLRRDTNICVWAKLIKTSLYKDNRIIAEEGVNMGEDYQVTPRLFYYSNHICHLDKVLYHYDMTNSGSITNTYSLDMNRQIWRAYDILDIFYTGKGIDYEESLKMSAIKLVIMNLIISVKCPKENKDYFYTTALKRLDLIDKKYWRSQPFLNRIILYLSNNNRLMTWYIIVCRYINNLYKRIAYYLKKNSNCI